jgi:thioredoxin-related protein
MTATQGMLYGGIAALAVGLAAMIAAPALSAPSESKPAPAPAQTKPAAASAAQGPAQNAVVWNRLDAALEQSAKSGKPVFVTVYADWCGYCRLLDKTTFVDPGVVSLLTSGWVAVKLNGESQTALKLPKGTITESQWAIGNGVQGFPANFLLDSKGKPFAAVPGYIEPPMMARLLKDGQAWIKGGGQAKLGDFYEWAEKR